MKTKNINHFYYLFFFSLLISFTASAQTIIKGNVTDNSTGKPVIGASIIITGTQTGTTSDASGGFSITLPAGSNQLTVSSLGFTTQTVKVKDATKPVNINMLPSGFDINGITITSDTSNLHAAQSISTLSMADINRSSGLSLQNSLNLVPGVQMQNREPWGGDRIIIRGYIPNLGSPMNLSVNTSSGFGYMAYINNIPITDATGNSILDDIDNGALGQVQVIKGPASPLYGSYIGGSVNLFTPAVAPGTTNIQEQVIGGSYGLFRNNTTISTATDKSSIWINYGNQTYDGFRPNDGSKKQFAQIAADFKTGDKNTISAYFSYNYSYEGLSGELDSNQVYGKQAVGDANYDNNGSHVLVEGTRGGITDKYKFNEHFSNQLTVFLTTRVINQVIAHGFTDFQEGDFGGREAFNFHYGRVDATLGGSFQKFNETLNGFSINHDSIAPFNPKTPGTPSNQQNYALNYNIFTQWAFKLPLDITLTVGGSMNFSEYGIQNMLSSGLIYSNPPILIGKPKAAFTPNASVIKVFNEKISAYANVGMGYTPPGLTNVLNSVNQPVTGLKPESAIQYEAGTKGKLIKGKFSYQLAVYDLEITDRFIQQFVNGISSFTNAGKESNKGVEVYAAYDVINKGDAVVNLLRPWISYTYDDAVYKSFQTFAKSGTGETVTGDYANKKAVGVAPNMFNAGVDVGTKAGFYLHGTFQFMDKVPFTFDNAHYMKAYSLLNGKIGWAHTFGHFSLDAFGGIDNLLSSTYYTSVFFAANIQYLAQANDLNYFPPGKNPSAGGDGYILPAPYKPTFYGGLKLAYNFR